MNKCISENCESDINGMSNYCTQCQSLRGRHTEQPSDAFHTHVDEHGALVRCYHRSKVMITSWEFWLASTIGFPIEHTLWELSPLKYITQWVGL